MVPRIKVWLQVGDAYVFGRGIGEILKAVDQTGSIKEAARVVGRSYRHVWSRIKETEDALGIPLVETQVGGHGRQRSHLTDVARDLVTAFDAWRERLSRLAEEEFAELFARHATEDSTES